jgi:catechol 2,3-dioxygenase-like lactoylglutathione lyase family enzyme
MGVQLNHTIVWATDRAASAAFLAGVLDLPVGSPVEPFLPLRLANDVTLDFAGIADFGASRVAPQHYAFLADDATFDAALARIRGAGVEYWADPMHDRPGEINHDFGGRGVYFADPDGHNMELQTKAMP